MTHPSRKPTPSEPEKTVQHFDRLMTGNLTMLMALEANGLEKHAGELVSKIGVGLARLARRPAAKVADPVTQIRLPDDQRGRSAFDIRELDRINARLAANNYRSTANSSAADKRQADLSRREELEQRPAVRLDRQWQRTSLAETMDLAEARGEEVDNPAKGVVRIRSRDGFHNLYVNLQLTQEEYDQGSEWRKCFEARSGDVGSQMGAESGGGGHDNNRFVGNRFLRASRTNLLAIAQRRIAMESSKEPAALQMFNEIVGNSKCLTSFGRGRAYDRHLSALKTALVWAEVARKEEAMKRGMAA